MDLLMKENFELKREIVFERKKYIDLQTQFGELKSNLINNEAVAASPNKSTIGSSMQAYQGNPNDLVRNSASS